MRNRFRSLTFVATILIAGYCFADADRDVIEAAKSATALLRIGQTSQIVRGSAVCVDPAGFFVTNGSNIQQTELKDLKLFVTPAGANVQKEYHADVIRTDIDSDLALLHVQSGDKFTALPIGDANGLLETQFVTSLGFTFGSPANDNTYGTPSLSVIRQRIASLSKVGGEVTEIRFNLMIDMNSRGGPLIDDSGKLVGIYAGSHGGITASRIGQLMAKGAMFFEPLHVTISTMHNPADFAVHIVQFGKETERTVEITLSANEADHRKFTAQAGTGGIYKISAVPVPGEDAKTLRLTVTFPIGTMSGTADNIPLKIGKRNLRLADIHEIQHGDTNTYTLADGTVGSDMVSGLEAVVVNFGSAKNTLDLSKASNVIVEDIYSKPATIAYTVTQRQGDKVLDELEGTIAVEPDAISKQPVAGTTTAPVAATPTPLASDRVEIRLPAAIDRVIPAASGRMLLLQMSHLRKMAVFDVQSGKLIKFLPLPSETTFVAAGSEKLIMVAPDQNIMQRWSLNTLEREVTVPVPEGTPATSIAMGYASTGPALYSSAGRLLFLDPATMKPIDVTFNNPDDPARPERPMVDVQTKLAASADGSTFTVTDTKTFNNGIRRITLHENKADVIFEEYGYGYFNPGIDGTNIFGLTGMYTKDLKHSGGDEFAGSCLPTYDPALFLTFPNQQTMLRTGHHNYSLSLYTTFDRHLLMTLPDMEELGNPGDPSYRAPALDLDQRISLFPAYSLLVVVPESADSLVLRRFDVMATLANSGIDYLFVNSIPIRTAHKGTVYTYQPKIVSKAGGVTCTLEGGPDGMAISPGGLVKWNVPANFDQPRVSVIVGVKDSTGQQIYHTFDITID